MIEKIKICRSPLEFQILSRSWNVFYKAFMNPLEGFCIILIPDRDGPGSISAVDADYADQFAIDDNGYFLVSQGGGDGFEEFRPFRCQVYVQ